MYDMPVITHSYLDWQMPEADLIDPGRTGIFFVRNDATSLPDTVMEKLDTAPGPDKMRTACRHIVQRNGTRSPAETIEQALLKLPQKDKV